MEVEWLFIILLPIIAFLYSSVGHGGASGYLALMALFAFPPEVMKPTGLLLNLFVAGIAFYHFWRAGHFSFKLFLYFSLGSIPLSYLGGLISIDQNIYKLILAVFLIFSILKMLNAFGASSKEVRSENWMSAIFIGAGIGFVSGLIGIGGGIILTPVILFMRWGDVRTAAAVSSLFIWVNSLSGLAGQYYAGIKFDGNIWVYVGLAVVGGFIGSYFGSNKLSNWVLRYLLIGVLSLAVIKLLII